MAVSRHLGFYRTANSAMRSADPENPSLEANMEWIGCTVFDRRTDRRTELAWHIRAIAYMLSRVKTDKKTPPPHVNYILSLDNYHSGTRKTTHVMLTCTDSKRENSRRTEYFFLCMSLE